MENQIVMIEIDKLHPHPDNPRKDLGDLTELTESIKRNGIMQNLTVVPETGYYDSEYRVIIGHRRLAAAKLAGISELPCVIRKLDYKEQVAMMLAENMQRSDLTVYEQAQGMQMMLDLGETVESVAERTGFSESTVRRRVKLTKLDADIFRETAEAAKNEGRQITLNDYEELFEIRDEAARNDALKTIGTDKFASAVRDAKYEEQRAAAKRELAAALTECAKEVDDATGLKYVNWGSSAERVRQIAEENPQITLYYKTNSFGADIYRDYTDEELAAAEERTAEQECEKEKITQRRAKADKLAAIGKKLFEFRTEFVRELLKNKAFLEQHRAVIIDFAVFLLEPNENWLLRASEYFDLELFGDVLGVEIDEDEDYTNDIVPELMRGFSPIQKLFALAYTAADGENVKCHTGLGVWQENIELEKLYGLFAMLGYEMSDEETAILNGTHELYES
ncbi:MAG: ParB/RepB/Spo0J family partition protein [Firmicutes bacterium]|nr:ParB/RepB/Spo0J family partition protein [Bacillota bacterium]